MTQQQPSRTKDDSAYEAYQRRMAALRLPAADRATYLKITSHLSNYSVKVLQHKRKKRQLPAYTTF